MPRRNTFNTFLAMAAGAATAVTAIEYTRQKRVAYAQLGKDSRLVETDLGVAEVATLGDGPAVLFSHGALAGYEQGLLLAKPLADAGYRLIVPSRPGYLRTPAIKDMSFAGQADFLAALLDALKIDQAIVLGMSSGGPAAIHLAARHPERVQALLLFSAISKQAFVDPETQTTATLMFGNLMHNDFLTWLGVQATIKTLPLMALAEPGSWRARLMSKPRRRALYEKLLWALFPSAPRLSGALLDKSQVENLSSLPLGKVTAPTLIVHGELDELVPFDHARNSAKKIDGARFLPIPGGDHACMVSFDDVVWPETLAFLQRPATATRKSAPKKPAARKPAARKAAPPAEAPAPKPAARRPARRTSTPAAEPPAEAPRPAARRSTRRPAAPAAPSGDGAAPTPRRRRPPTS